jgi:ribonuclease BN (tRNA processing enzyme)
MTLELTFLGTGNAFAPTRYWSSFLANDHVLFDAPPTLLAHLKKLDKDPGQIDVVFISHFHGDHYFGLPFLLLEFAELSQRKRALTIVGPPGIAKRLQSVTDLAFSNVFRKPQRGYDLHFIEARNGRGGELGDCEFLARKVTHVDGLECFGYRVQTEHGIIAYSGDTMMCDALVPLADGADVFVVECSCWGDHCGPHLTPADILELRRRIRPSTKFVLTHIGGGEAPQAIHDAGIVIADDLKTVFM